MSEVTPEAVREFVLASHMDLDKVKKMLAEDPRLLNVVQDWGPGGTETPLGAAAHVGNRPIAEFLLAQGAESNICVDAMLGNREAVQKALEADESLAKTKGAHGITIMFHAAMSGDTAITQMLVDHGGGEGMNPALFGAVRHGRVEMVKWLLDQGAQDFAQVDFQKKTPLQVAEAGGHTEIAALLREHGATE